MNLTSAYVHGHLTRQQFIEAQARAEAIRKEFLCQANAEQVEAPCRCALHSNASEDAR
jgi:hypothetical protein